MRTETQGEYAPSIIVISGDATRRGGRSRLMAAIDVWRTGLRPPTPQSREHKHNRAGIKQIVFLLIGSTMIYIHHKQLLHRAHIDRMGAFSVCMILMCCCAHLCVRFYRVYRRSTLNHMCALTFGCSIDHNKQINKAAIYILDKCNRCILKKKRLTLGLLSVHIRSKKPSIFMHHCNNRVYDGAASPRVRAVCALDLVNRRRVTSMRRELVIIMIDSEYLLYWCGADGGEQITNERRRRLQWRHQGERINKIKIMLPRAAHVRQKTRASICRILNARSVDCMMTMAKMFHLSRRRLEAIHLRYVCL